MALDYDLLARCRRMLEDESRRLRTKAREQQVDPDVGMPLNAIYAARESTAYATCAEACYAAEQAIYHVFDVLYVELDDTQAEEAMKNHA
jgi:hypothetical protein